MNDSEDVVGDKTASETESKKSGMLRWWPAAFLVLVMVVLRSLLFIVESPPLPMMLVAFMGSGVCGLLILLWWLFASRATLKEKLVLFAGFLLVAVVLCGALHPSLQGMGIMLFVLPTGCAAFAIGAILTASRQGIRKPVVLLSTFLGFGIWSMLQVQGFDGKFKGDFRWRWQPTDEDEFLASISDRKKLQEETTSTEEVVPDPEWPGFRGKDRTGVVRNIVLSEDWENDPPKEIWRTAVGPGWSSFSIAGDRLFTQEQRGESEAV
ncbi:MAG: alcohol dehydrogenase, partial [Planctomycetota bacterium]